MKNIALLALMASMLFYFPSCVDLKPLPGYLKNVSDSIPSYKLAVVKEMKIKRNDPLQIIVYSSATIEGANIEKPYNLPASGSGTGPQSEGLNYLVDINGNIELPLLGSIHVEGLTRNELTELIQTKLQQRRGELVNPGVVVRFARLNVSVLGEVKQPGLVKMVGEKMNILEALSEAGDITEYGVKKAVKVSREINGEAHVGIIDLTSPSLFQSPYFYLEQNDIVMVDQASIKSRLDSETRIVGRTTFVFGVATTILLILNNVLKK